MATDSTNYSSHEYSLYGNALSLITNSVMFQGPCGSPFNFSQGPCLALSYPSADSFFSVINYFAAICKLCNPTHVPVVWCCGHCLYFPVEQLYLWNQKWTKYKMRDLCFQWQVQCFWQGILHIAYSTEWTGLALELWTPCVSSVSAAQPTLAGPVATTSCSYATSWQTIT